MMKNFLRIILTIFLLFNVITVWAGGANTQVIINPTGGTSNADGLRVYIGSNSQVQAVGWSTPSSPATAGAYPQMFNGCGTAGCTAYAKPVGNSAVLAERLHNSVVLRVDDGSAYRVYHNADHNSADPDYRTALFTQVSQTGVSGTGTAADPYVVVTVLSPPAPDNAVQVTITDTYVVPDPFFMRKIDLSGLDPTYQYKLYWFIDTYLAGNDAGFPFTQITPGNMTGIPDFIGVTRPGVLQGIQTAAGAVLWDHHYSSAWKVNNIGNHPLKLIYDAAGGDLDNSVTTSVEEDNAIAVQWTIPPGLTDYQVNTGQSYGSSAIMSEAFLPQSIFVDETSVLTITFANYDTGIATTSPLDSVYHLPADLSYVGAIIANTCNGSTATVSGNDLIFEDIALLPASSPDSPETCEISITVTSAIPGVYTGTVDGLSSGLSRTLSPQRTLTVLQLKMVTPIPAINAIGLAALAALLGLLAAVHGLRGRKRC
ncbi:MAG: hypothetical protein LBS40_05040 [Burkholderiales bacterium]|nr:hypothetical protein [Burkholderiales bacterium]